MTTTELISWLRLSHCKNVGPVTFWQALARFGSCQKALEWLVNNRRAAVIPEERWAIQVMENCAKKGVSLVTGEDNRYPLRLRTLRDAPAILFVKGTVDILNSDMVALVGARNCSFSGKRQAQILASDLAMAGFTIVSGLARGVDRAAHMGSIETGTIAVLAGGVDVVYPPDHEELYDQIQRKGCIVSEMPLETRPAPNHFPRRNRIISGLSRGVVVVEAAVRSGSLITAQYALEQARDLFAVPGSPQDPRCHGSNQLLKQGAYLVQSAEDVLRVLKPEFDLATLEEPAAEPYVASVQDFSTSVSLKDSLLEGLSPIPVALDFIANDIKLTMQELMAVVLELELEGSVVRQPNGMISLSESLS
jgi:DNA processing protein